MKPLTTDQCRQLAGAFPECFICAESHADEPYFEFSVGDTVIIYWFAPIDLWALDNDNFISPEVGLAALTAKCKEVAGSNRRGLHQQPRGWYVVPDYDYGLADTPWAALLSTVQEATE